MIDSHRWRAHAWGAIALGFVPLLFGIAAADPPPTPEPLQQPALKSGKPDLETVTITAEQRKLLERKISKFVSSITLPARDESLARWQEPICPLVAGLSRDGGEFVLARVSQAARDAGAPLAPEKCEPNFLIVLTSEPEELLKKWWKRSPKMFNDERGIGGVHHYIITNHPIRVWYNATSACGGTQSNFQVEGGTVYPSCVNGGMSSKLNWQTVRKITSVIVIADTGRVGDLTTGQLADYISMIGLAQIRENASLGDAPTILRLFAENGEARLAGLSRWDQAFLKSLYATDSSKVMQMADMKFSMYGVLVP